MLGRQSNAPATFTPGEIPGTHFQRLSRPQGTWFCRGVPRKKSPVTRPGIDPGTVRLVAQRLNHYGLNHWGLLNEKSWGKYVDLGERREKIKKKNSRWGVLRILFVNKYYYSDKIQDDQMDRRCSTHGKMRNVDLILVINIEEKLEECKGRYH